MLKTKEVRVRDYPKAKWRDRLSQNALAGGIAGAIVSCALHPIDTIKTIMQADKGSQRALVPLLSNIISERGIGGLYRGIMTNLATSAPISAIYTSTYEAVKEAVLPKLPPGYASVAHCFAGACASMATSIVYTPSETVKQRLQVGCQYNSSWSALVGIIRTEGFASLYVGLGAVLCRNVPQSIIKFLTYEKLKQLALESKPESQNLSPPIQLCIGGIAGSTASFFTTPFDVIKTRLQTQMKTSLKYKGVLHTMKTIVVEEGIFGLYRGLVPRLFIYMSQGAIFFASYELLKYIFSIKFSPKVHIQLPSPFVSKSTSKVSSLS